jgi:hypothetical protein
METRPESRVAAEAVERILAAAEAAVEAVGRRSEQELRRIDAELDARAAEEAEERRLRLERLRAELGERARALAGAYAAILGQLAGIEAALAGEPLGPDGQASRAEAGRVAAIKMTLRERQRIDLTGELPTQLHEAVPIPRQPQPQQRIRRRRWLPWQREAA